MRKEPKSNNGSRINSNLSQICLASASAPRICNFYTAAKKLKVLGGQALAQIDPYLIPEHHNREPINTDKADCPEIADF